METAVKEIKKHGKYITSWVEGTLKERFAQYIEEEHHG
jgi:hypothetical protein